MDIREDDIRVSGETHMKGVILELAREISLWSSFSLVAIRGARPEDLEKKDALQWYQGELEKNPNDKSLWYEMGTLLAKKGLCDEAVEAFGRVTSLDPLHSKAWDAKAKAFVRLERYQEALDCFDRAIGIDPDFSDAWYGRGQAVKEIEKQPDDGIVQEPRVKTQNEDHQENAESETTSTLPSTVPSDQDGSDHFLDESERSETGPGDGADENDHLLAANVQRYAGNTEGALRLYDEAIRINPDFLDAWYAKGTLLYILDRYREALECLDKVLLLNPDHEWARKRKAQIETLTNSKEGSEKTSPDDVEGEETRGEEDGAARPDLTVVRAFKQSWDRISDKENLIRKARECCDAGEYDTALAHYDKALEIDWNEYRAWKGKGEILSIMERNEEATECFERALKINPGDETVWHDEGKALHAEGKRPEALVALKKAVSLEPEFAEAWHEAGVVLRSLGRTYASHEAIQEAFKLYFLRTAGFDDEEGISPEKESKEAILEVRSQEDLHDARGRRMSIDGEDRKILMSVWNRAKTVSQISKRLGIPIAECYKRVRNLRNVGLLRRLRYTSVLDPERKTIDLYKLDSREGTVLMRKGRLMMEIPSSSKQRTSRILS